MNLNILAKKSKGRHASRTSASLPSMTVIGSAQPDVLRIKVYKPSNDGNELGCERGASKKLCIDPRLASYRTIQCLIAQAFDIKSEFTINAVQKCSASGLEKLTAIWSDWDLENAIKHVENGSYLRLRYELVIREEGTLDDWDFVALNDSTSNIRWFHVDNRSIIATVNSTTGKKSSTLHKAIKYMYGGQERNNSKPVNTDTLKKFFDCEGRLEHPHDLRQAIYEGGVEPSCRYVAWQYLLNICPINMTTFDRNEYLEEVSYKYEKLKKRWENERNCGENIRAIMRAIHTDVVRTDRTFKFYASSGDLNVNLKSLHRILVTYCISHPSIPYCQGMNEYASTLLYVMRDESLAYLCFCALMRRIRANFATDGVAIATKFHHLKVLLQAVDPVYWNFFETCDTVNLYFTYRWLLLECKREFSFNESLRVLEVMWATLPIDNEPPELSEGMLLPLSSGSNLDYIRYSIPYGLAQRRALSCPELSLIDESRYRKNRQHSSSVTCHGPFDKSTSRTSSVYHDFSVVFDDEHQFNSSIKYHHNSSSPLSRSREKIFENSFSLSEISEFELDTLSTCSSHNTSKSNHSTSQSSSSSSSSSSDNWVSRLPTDDTIWLDDDNSFLLFLCISILLTHRSHLLKQKNLDEQEIAMHFDRYRRRHNAERSLKCARTHYEQYIQWARKKRMLDDLNSFSAS